jgi:hypothetical protein
MLRFFALPLVRILIALAIIAGLVFLWPVPQIRAAFDARQSLTSQLSASQTKNTQLQSQIDELKNQTPASSVDAPDDAPAETVEKPAAEASSVDSCPQARDLGPWAPDNEGNGETFEVTASDQGASNLSSSGVVLGLWWPKGSGQEWGTQEITTFIPRGMSVTIIKGAGRGWDYESTCASSEVKTQMQAHMDARKNDTAYFGYVSLEDLISAGLVEVRFDRRAGSNPTP